MTVTLYHNPKCSTSRKVLEMLRDRGLEPEIVDYMKTPPDTETLKAIVAATGKDVRALLRRRGTPFEALGLDDPALGDAAIYAAIAEHPVLIERPIVVSAKGARLGRPPEAVLEIL
ncbi:MAG: arsenate reductase (glutaredoxin) [Hyphomicrobiaceae bacterium]|nr:arsenate reductase (glutaredoxin) [Hyphomicrobiaceae bacterium]